MVFRKGAFDNFDTIFMVGRFMEEEHRKTEAVYGRKRKNLVPVGYPYLGDLIRNYKRVEKSGRTRILVAPSYQDGNILDSCLDGMIAALSKMDIDLVLRPHPQYVRRFPAKWQSIKTRHANVDGRSVIVFDDDFSRPADLYRADILISDWSSIAYEFSFVTKKPSILINTPPKIINPEYKKIGIEPTDITFRDRIGQSINIGDIGSIANVVSGMIANPQKFTQKIEGLLVDEFYDPLIAGEIAGKYILETLISKKKGTKK
jgi:YidC/Oxa1 family membrane protein insertase